MRYADCYENSLHEADKRSVVAFKKLIQDKEIEYRILIDLHDNTPPSKVWREAIRAVARGYLRNIPWAPVYVDNEGEVVFTWRPHFISIVPKYNKSLLGDVTRYLLLRHGDIPPCMISGTDEMQKSLDYMRWYRNCEKSGLNVIPAGIAMSDLSSDYEIGENHLVVECLPKIDLLTTEEKNGNVYKITPEDGFSFVENLVNHFLENLSRDV